MTAGSAIIGTETAVEGGNVITGAGAAIVCASAAGCCDTSAAAVGCTTFTAASGAGGRWRSGGKSSGDASIGEDTSAMYGRTASSISRSNSESSSGCSATPSSSAAAAAAAAADVTIAAAAASAAASMDRLAAWKGTAADSGARTAAACSRSVAVSYVSVRDSAIATKAARPISLPQSSPRVVQLTAAG